ncbi:hypothetical protein D039_4151, partial [Vibrio parahaemolyticus EKP-028]
MKYNVSV